MKKMIKVLLCCAAGLIVLALPASAWCPDPEGTPCIDCCTYGYQDCSEDCAVAYYPGCYKYCFTELQECKASCNNDDGPPAAGPEPPSALFATGQENIGSQLDPNGRSIECK